MKNTSLVLIQLFVFGVASLSFIPTSSAERSCVRSRDGKVVCGELLENETTNGNKKPLNKKKMVESQSGVDFTLEGCKKSRTGVGCSISIYNSTEFDKEISWNIFMGENVLLDNTGNQYLTQAIKLGNSTNNSVVLPPKATVKARVFFRPNGELDNYIRILKIAPIIEGNNNIRLTFRNLKLI